MEGLLGGDIFCGGWGVGDGFVENLGFLGVWVGLD